MIVRILKKDLKRKRTMNVILLIFIILASTFIASGVSNMCSVVTALPNYFEKTNVPDFWSAVTSKEDLERGKELMAENGYAYEIQSCLQADTNQIRLEGKPLDYSSSILISKADSSVKVFDSKEQEITGVKEGEIYIPYRFSNLEDDDFHIGSRLEITMNGVTRTFTVKDFTKDVLYGSPMLGVTQFLVSEYDFSLYEEENENYIYSFFIRESAEEVSEKWENNIWNALFNVDKKTIETMYIMDILIAAVILIVSVCLILISMVILFFVIRSTIQEEYREIGVMKAIGIPNGVIRHVYLVKYFAIALTGSAVGFVLSIPFGNMLLRDVSKNIIISRQGGIGLNFFCAALCAGIVILFCVLCTRKMKHISPVTAIRNGESGERFSHKSVLRLGKSRLSPVFFMAWNDILSSIRKFMIMLVVFILGLLLIMIPVNTINTLRSDDLITWFNMSKSDHIISREIFAGDNTTGRKGIEEELRTIRERLEEKGIKANVFQEAMFRMKITHGEKIAASLAFQGLGDIRPDAYVYEEGVPPENPGEIALADLIAEKIGVQIGDKVEITNGDNAENYIVTALYQSMNNMGEGIRFCPDQELDYRFINGGYGIQILYTDSPNKEMLAERKAFLQELYPEEKIFTSGEYVDFMIGNISAQIVSIKFLIVAVVLGINLLVTVLMVKSFISQEKKEIALLKATGFQSSSVVLWQTVRIGIILLFSTIAAVLLQMPLSELTVGPVFQMMGAQRIEFEIVPLEIFVLYPAIVFSVTVLAAWMTALQSGKITASETSNIE